MADHVQSVAGQRVLFYAEAGPPVGGDDGALAVIGAAAAAGAGTVVVPVSRLAPGFLRLSTGWPVSSCRSWSTIAFA